MRAAGDYGYRFAGPPGWRRIPPVTRGVMVASTAGYLATLLLVASMELLMADPGRILAGELWRLFTYPLVVRGVINLLFALLIFWSFGTELERHFGSKRYGIFLLLATACAGAVGVALSRIAALAASAGAGPWGLVTTVIVAWALLGPNLPSNLYGILPLPRIGIAILALIVAFFGTFEGTRSLVQVGFALGGLPVAWLYTRRRGAAPPLAGLHLPRFLRRRRFRVVKSGDQDRFRFH